MNFSLTSKELTQCRIVIFTILVLLWLQDFMIDELTACCGFSVWGNIFVFILNLLPFALGVNLFGICIHTVKQQPKKVALHLHISRYLMYGFWGLILLMLGIFLFYVAEGKI